MGREGKPRWSPAPRTHVSDADSFCLQLMQAAYAGLMCLGANGRRIIPHSHLEFKLPFKGSFLT